MIAVITAENDNVVAQKQMETDLIEKNINKQIGEINDKISYEKELKAAEEQKNTDAMLQKKMLINFQI